MCALNAAHRPARFFILHPGNLLQRIKGNQHVGEHRRTGPKQNQDQANNADRTGKQPTIKAKMFAKQNREAQDDGHCNPNRRHLKQNLASDLETV